MKKGIKILIIAWGCFSIGTVFAQTQPGFWRTSHVDPPPTAEEIAAQRAAEKAAEEADLAEKYKYFVPRDPWRITTNRITANLGVINKTETNYAKGPAWLQFDGQVKGVLADGIIVQGWYGTPMDFAHGESNVTFVICNFPYTVQVGTQLNRAGKYVALHVSDFYTGTRYIPRFDYGKVSKIPPGAVATNTSAPEPVHHHKAADAMP